MRKRETNTKNALMVTKSVLTARKKNTNNAKIIQSANTAKQREKIHENTKKSHENPLMATKSALTAPKKHEKRENHTKREQRDEKKNTKNTLKRSNGQSTAKSHRKQFTCGCSGGLQRGSA